MIRWTAEELEEMRRADEEIEAEFQLTTEDLRRQRADDRAAKLAALPNDKKAIAEKQRAYREANREAVAAQQRAYREANREAIAAQQRAYREANREALAEKQRAYREANREAVAAQQRAYREANREAIAAQQRAYREANREAVAAQQRWIADARKENGYSQTALAEICSCSQPTISLLERGAMKLSQCAQRDAICWWLKGMDYEDLMAQGV